MFSHPKRHTAAWRGVLYAGVTRWKRGYLISWLLARCECHRQVYVIGALVMHQISLTAKAILFDARG